MKDSYKYFSRFYDSLIEPMNSGLRSIGFKMLPPKSGMKVLDIGCGPGDITFEIARKTQEVFATDISEGMISAAKQNAIKKKVLTRNAVLGNFFMECSFQFV